MTDIFDLLTIGCPVVRRWIAGVNYWMSPEERPLLTPHLVPSPAVDPDVEWARAWVLVDGVLRRIVPLALDALRCPMEAERMRSIPPITDRAGAKFASGCAREVCASLEAQGGRAGQWGWRLAAAAAAADDASTAAAAADDASTAAAASTAASDASAAAAAAAAADDAAAADADAAAAADDARYPHSVWLWVYRETYRQRLAEYTVQLAPARAQITTVRLELLAQIVALREVPA